MAMKPVSPVVSNANHPEVIYAKDQPEYLPLPSIRLDNGMVITRWKCETWRERLRILMTGSVYLSLLTFGQPLQPSRLDTEVPEELQKDGAE